MHKYFFIHFQIFLSIWLTATADHVSVVSCTERADCQRRIDSEVAAAIFTNLRNASDPCENFWEYACGEWTAAPFYDHIDTFGAVDNYFARRMHKHLEVDTPTLQNTPADISTLLGKMRAVYRACKSIDSYFLPLKSYLKVLVKESEQSVQWPHTLEALQAWQSAGWTDGRRNFSWLNVIAELRRYGLNGVFLDESMGVAFNDATRSVIELKMPEDDDDGADSFVSKYEIIENFVEFDWIENQDAATTAQLRIAAEIFTLETQLKDLRKKHSAAVNTKNYGGRKSTTAAQDKIAIITLEELKRQVPNIDWHAYFSILLGLQTPPVDLPIEVEGRAYMRDMAALLTQTDDKVIAAYVLLRLCKYVRAIAPQITTKNCIDHMGVVMPLGLDYLYDRLVYGSERHRRDESALQAIFSKLKLQFGEYLQQNRLHLSEQQQRYLRTKLERMQLRLGNLPLHMPTEFYDRYYDAVNVSEIIESDAFYRNHLKLLRFRTQQQHAALLASATVPRDDFFVNDDIRQLRNAPYFVHQRNLLIVPLLFVQPPFFHHGMDALLQYSLMGWILGHELNHAFETEGILLDADGNESQSGAAIRASRQFQAATQCLERQQPPSAALIERIADVNGLQLAYDAFFGSSNVPPAAPPFAAEFSAAQLFFLNFAQFFCGTLPRPIGHDRDDVRVMATVAQLPEFATAFNCESNSRENPTEKCQMWRSKFHEFRQFY